MRTNQTNIKGAEHLIMPIILLALRVICLMCWLNLRWEANNTPKSLSSLHRFDIKGVPDFFIDN